MKLFKNPFSLLFMFVIFSQCATGKEFETKVSFELGEVYYQEWSLDSKADVSGINIFISIEKNPKNIEFDSVYFHGKQTKLKLKSNSVYIGRFENRTKLKNDIIMSHEPYREYGNKVPVLTKKSPFQLKENVCIVSYKTSDKVKYFKIENINKK
ncbi:hypothetical protein QLS71_006655 [Mariniflexile litorale]|uniref:Lipoprotein n=1 Tax=Mariniflexile litorale TaxID=3045158 RepID=A0AAU7EJK9_9FLAO|nr:hypothetical protein [Mariniflexile sp. KMM 9835]MDQ8211371.1 hypothetical protein [Mariniflexile sp. KMM 9835]